MKTLFSALTSPMNLYSERRNYLRHGLMLGCVLAGSVFTASAVRAAGVVTEPTEAAFNAALQGGGTVTFACDGTIPITTTKNIAADTTIDATGHNITLDAGGQYQMFTVTGTSYIVHDDANGNYRVVTYRALTLKHLTLTRGFAASGGVASLAVAKVTIADCRLLNNKAGNGGALYATSKTFTGYHPATYGNTVTITDSVFAGNTADSDGGAISTPGNSISLTRCAFLNNSAGGSAVGRGGGLYAPQGATLVNCTLAGNRTLGGNGGGLYVAGTTSLTNCTLARNSLGASGISGGGLASASGTCTLTNTLLAENTVDGIVSNAQGTLADGGHNICSDASAAFTSSTSFNNTDARLGPLVYPGNATPTLSLLGGSPAIDAGDDSKAPTTDQRGAARQGSHRDIGAYERPVWQADALAVNRNNNTLALWNHNQGAMDLWSVNSASGNINASFLYGPYAGWTSVDLAVGTDNHARILWKHVNGQVDVWSVDTATGTPLYEREYPALPGWSGAAISVGGDGNTRLAWRSPQGSLRLWTLDETTGTRLSETFLTPPDGWSFAAMATGADNQTRILWNYVSGLQNIGSVDAAGNVTASYSYGPFAGWTASRLSVGADNQTRILWNHVQGYQCLWSVNSASGSINSSVTYGNYSGWNSLAIATGSDNNTRLLWNHISGQQSFWNVDRVFNILIQPGYGPY